MDNCRQEVSTTLRREAIITGSVVVVVSVLILIDGSDHVILLDTLDSEGVDDLKETW